MYQCRSCIPISALGQFTHKVSRTSQPKENAKGRLHSTAENRERSNKSGSLNDKVQSDNPKTPQTSE